MSETTPKDDVKIMIYSLSTCNHCKAAKQLVSDHTDHYDFVDLDLMDKEERKPLLEDLKQLNPRCSFPTVVIGDTVVVGYREAQIKEALGL